MCALREKYGSEGYACLDEEDWLSFVSSCGRWIVSYSKSTGQFLHVDGHWVVNLKNSEVKDEVGSV